MIVTCVVAIAANAVVFAACDSTDPSPTGVHPDDGGGSDGPALDAIDASDASDLEDADFCGRIEAGPPLGACSWDTTKYPHLDGGTDADAEGGPQCASARARLACYYAGSANTGGQGAFGGCLADNPERCPDDPILGAYTEECCQNLCAPNEYAVGCPPTATNVPRACRNVDPPAPGAGRYATYCCACE
jgi:hypothetical protein